MQPGARLKAAEEILDDILTRHRPAALALADWGKNHRFAGSGDRNAIGGVVYDALRRRSSIAWAMDSDSPRALALGAAPAALGLSAEAVVAACTGAPHALEPPSDAEVKGIARPTDGAPAHVHADVPEWLWPSFERSFGERAVLEGRKLAERAPTDLRVNTLKADRLKVLKALSEFGARETALSPVGIRIPAPVGTARTPNLTAEAAFQAGWFEVQDEGSQLVSLLACGEHRVQVLDLCAGAGGKTLAMAAAMQNTGQIYAYDEDRHRLKPIHERLKRAGARNVQVLRGGDRTALDALAGRFDLVLVDAPCTGTGVWRRRPEAKWKLRPHSLAQRLSEQAAVLETAGRMVRPGGRVVYLTCSILAEENSEQVATFLASSPGFRLEPYDGIWRERFGTQPPMSANGDTEGLLLTPGTNATDGFYFAALRHLG